MVLRHGLAHGLRRVVARRGAEPVGLPVHQIEPPFVPDRQVDEARHETLTRLEMQPLHVCGQLPGLLRGMTAVHVVAVNLIDTLSHLKKSIGMIVLRVLPKAGVHAVGRFFVVIQKRIGFLTS